jgi:hypothetical protein
MACDDSFCELPYFFRFGGVPDDAMFFQRAALA